MVITKAAKAVDVVLTKLTEFVESILDAMPFVSGPPRVISADEYYASKEARAAQDAQELAAWRREAAYYRMAEDRAAGKHLAADDVKALSRNDLENIKAHGDDYMRRLIDDHLHEKERSRSWGRVANYIGLRKKLWGHGAGERMWNFFYHRTIKNLGGITHHLAPQPELAELAHPFYNQFARGGEGHLEVGKNVYYTVHKMCHMVLALKPFGCMPSSQSDGVQSAVINKFKDMIFLPIETSGEGEVNAHSRVQMALGEAKVKAKAEFEQCLKSTGKTMSEIRAYIDEHPELKRPFYHVPHREGVAGTAAQFVLHVNDRIDKDTRFWKRSRVRVDGGPGGIGRLVSLRDPE